MYMDGEIYIDGFNNPGQFPIRNTSIESLMYPACSNPLDWVDSTQRISLTNITSL